MTRLLNSMDKLTPSQGTYEDRIRNIHLKMEAGNITDVEACLYRATAQVSFNLNRAHELAIEKNKDESLLLYKKAVVTLVNIENIFSENPHISHLSHPILESSYAEHSRIFDKLSLLWVQEYSR